MARRPIKGYDGGPTAERFTALAANAPAPIRDRADDLTVPSGQIASEGGIGQPVPPRPAPRSWFARTWQYLFVRHLLDNPDQIVTFSHSGHSITVRLANGSEYCLMKANL